MTPRQVVFVTFVALGLFILVLELIRRHMLREKYSLAWFFICVVMLTVPLLYDVYLAFGRLVGIVYPASLFFFMAIVGLVLLSLQFSLALSTAYFQRKAMIQQMALLESRVSQLEKALGGDKPAAPESGAEIAPKPGPKPQ